MMAWLLSPLGRLALGAAMAVALAGGAYVAGRGDGAAAVRDRLAADRVTILQDGKEIDLETLTLDDAGLCAVLGGC